jgi:hypothetical protein
MVLFQWLTDNDYQPRICQLLLIILLLQCHIIRNCHYLHCLTIAIGRLAYQAKKKEEEQINVVLFVNEN